MAQTCVLCVLVMSSISVSPNHSVASVRGISSPGMGEMNIVCNRCDLSFDIGSDTG
jgi:hypothetical protein